MHPVSLPIQGYRGALFAPRRSDTKGIAPQSRAHRSAAYFIYAYYNSRYVSYKTSPPVRAIAQCCARIAHAWRSKRRIMLFSSLFFIYGFLPPLLILFYAVPRTGFRRVLLIIASLLFYAWGEPIYVLLMIGTVLADWLLGRLIGEQGGKSDRARRVLCVLTVLINIALLGVFKYTDFIIGTVNSVFGCSLPLPGIRLPIGISFFIFQALSYIIDVYRGMYPPQRSFSRLLLYISFFPQLIAGPIVRYGDIAPALDEIKPDTHDVFRGVCRFARGLGKKVLISNYCAAAVAALDALTGAPALTTVWARALLFTLQIYFDFSGYSDMAIGLGRMLGFDFPENFNYPFVSASATEFWRRWHISLSSWFRDYLFYPVLRSRAMNSLSRSLRAHGHKKAARAAITVTALLCVWSATGLWHGASWNYVLWGLYYFVLLTLEMFIQPHLKKHLPRAVSGILAHIYFALITVFGMAIFSSESNVFASLGRLLGIGVCGFSNVFTEAVLREYLYLIIAALLLSLPMIPALRRLIYRRFGTPPVWLRAAVGTLFVIVTVAASSACLVGNTYNPFLYFRF